MEEELRNSAALNASKSDNNAREFANNASTPDAQPVRRGRGGFKPGNPTRFKPGNPGRRLGARHKTTVMCEKLMLSDAKEVVQAVITAARKGDMAACKIILDRVSPIRKGRAVHLNIGETTTADDVAAALAGVVNAMASGELTPDEAALVAGVLEVRRKTVETVELEDRLARLEAKVSI